VNVEFKESFARDLRSIKDKPLLKRVKELIERVEQAQHIDELGNLKKLKGGGHYYRIRIGDYRVGLIIEDDVVIFVRFLNRKEVYRYFP
jgi:mRNA interferase RelE/StbE